MLASRLPGNSLRRLAITSNCQMRNLWPRGEGNCSKKLRSKRQRQDWNPGQPDSKASAPNFRETPDLDRLVWAGARYSSPSPWSPHTSQGLLGQKQGLPISFQLLPTGLELGQLPLHLEQAALQGFLLQAAAHNPSGLRTRPPGPQETVDPRAWPATGQVPAYLPSRSHAPWGSLSHSQDAMASPAPQQLCVGQCQAVAGGPRQTPTPPAPSGLGRA